MVSPFDLAGDFYFFMWFGGALISGTESNLTDAI